MRALVAFARFWYDFVVGDDWRVACGVAIALPVTAIAAHSGVAMWWLLPLVVAGLLALSVLDGARAARTRRAGAVPREEPCP